MEKDALWSVQLFGGLRVSGPDTEIDRFPTRRAALLLARVALSRSGAIGRDDLADVLWPDDYLDATRLRLRQELNRLRETLGSAADILTADRSWVRIDLSSVVIDAKEFYRYLSALNAETEDNSIDLRAKALSLYTGPLLPEQSEDWVQAERQEYHAKHLSVLIEQTDALLGAKRTEDALACALRAVRSDPYYEPARMAAIRAFVEVGDLGPTFRSHAASRRFHSRQEGHRSRRIPQA
jgi:DNA-binding SARP family transcriptional activator